MSSTGSHYTLLPCAFVNICHNRIRGFFFVCFCCRNRVSCILGGGLKLTICLNLGSSYLHPIIPTAHPTPQFWDYMHKLPCRAGGSNQGLMQAGQAFPTELHLQCPDRLTRTQKSAELRARQWREAQESRGSWEWRGRSALRNLTAGFKEPDESRNNGNLAAKN